MNQNEKVLDYLKRGGRLTPLKAQRMFGITRLAARVCDLKLAGYRIKSRRRRVRGREGSASVSEYSL